MRNDLPSIPTLRQALFLKHDGFVGAIGTHMRGNAMAGAVERMGPPPPTCDVDTLKPPKRAVPPARQHARHMVRRARAIVPLGSPRSVAYIYPSSTMWPYAALLPPFAGTDLQ